MWTFSGRDGRIFCRSLLLSLHSPLCQQAGRPCRSSDFLSLLSSGASERAIERLSPFNKAFMPNSCLSPAAAAASSIDTRQSTQQRTKEGDRGEEWESEADAFAPSLIAPLPRRSRRLPPAASGPESSNQIRRPKSILGFCPAEFICLGHLTLPDFPPSPPLPSPTPSCLLARPPGDVVPRHRRNIKSISERRCRAAITAVFMAQSRL